MILIAEQKLSRPQLSSGYLTGCRVHHASLCRWQNFAKGIIWDSLNLEVIIQWIRVFNHENTAMVYVVERNHSMTVVLGHHSIQNRSPDPAVH